MQYDKFSSKQRKVAKPAFQNERSFALKNNLESTFVEEVASDDELPEILRPGRWSIGPKVPEPVNIKASLLRRNMPLSRGAVTWPKGSAVPIFDFFRSAPNPKYDRQFNIAVTKFIQNSAFIPLEVLVKVRGPLFIEFWNAHAVDLMSRVSYASRPKGLNSEDLKWFVESLGLLVLPGILNVGLKKPELAMDALLLVDAIDAPALMVKWSVGEPEARVVKQWINDFIVAVTHKVLPVALGAHGWRRRAAEQTLRTLVAHGHRDTIENIAADYEVKGSLAEVLAFNSVEAVETLKMPEIPSSWSCERHPPPRLAASGKKLPTHAIETLVKMILISPADKPISEIEKVRKVCDKKSLANFAWSAFEEWAQSKRKKDTEWIFNSLAYLGDDECARKLTPYIREWPRLGCQPRSIQGLRILSSIGSDIALSQIQAISLKNQFESVQGCARRTMEEIAEARNLTPQQFEDRLVPDLGLSGTGTIKLDFGTRYFTGAVDAQLKPFIVDELGSPVKSLPTPTKSDDKALAKESTKTWAGFCKELKPAARLQLFRLELAMVNSRRWSGDDFKRLLIARPLLQSLVRGLVWGVFQKNGNAPLTFIVNTKGECIDATGQCVKLVITADVGIVHPLMMADSLSSWRELFEKNRQAQPFAQLARKTYRARDDADKNLFGLVGAIVPSMALKGLKAMGWRAEAGDSGMLLSFYRECPSGKASITVEPGVHMEVYEHDGHKEQKLCVDVPSTLDEMEFSELIRGLQTLRK